MADFSTVPVIDITSENIDQVWPMLISAIKSATYIAIDNELSGLGERKYLFAKSIDDRYKGICDAAKTRSIISIGLSCFKLKSVQNMKSLTSNKDDTQETAPSSTKPASFHDYEVQTFNIFSLCSENYIVEPMSLKFLVNHGFDFNRQYAGGIPYCRGNDKPDKPEAGSPQHNMRDIFTLILQTKAPVVLHNALVDLIFLYQSLYASLPANLATFVCDISEIYKGGVYDTKYMTEFKVRMPASYLEYVFRKSQRENSTASTRSWSHVKVTFPAYSAGVQSDVVLLPCALQTSEGKRGKTEACQNYAVHGWCSNTCCPKSHDIDIILDSEDNVTAKKSRRRQKHKEGTENSNGAGDTPPVSEENPASSGLETEERIKSRVEGHRAGFDAFMTGFIFAFFTARYGCVSNPSGDLLSLTDLGVEEFANKVFLSGKDIPLQVTKSAFAKTSQNHKDKMQKLEGSC